MVECVRSDLDDVRAYDARDNEGGSTGVQEPRQSWPTSLPIIKCELTWNARPTLVFTVMTSVRSSKIGV